MYAGTNQVGIQKDPVTLHDSTNEGGGSMLGSVNPYQVKRGVYQGGPLSCTLFNITIEPLACRIRSEPRIKEISILGLIEKLAIKLFADNTNLYLSKEDNLDLILKILED